MNGTSAYRPMTILHIEDDPALADLVGTIFKSMGFRGEIVQTHSVAEALATLSEREERKESLELILVDMQLPDGTGLDVVRQVKGSPVWQRTPVIILSGESAPGLVNEAYALGANCYLPKLSRVNGALGSIKALHQCWIESALLPKPAFTDRVQEALAKAIQLRARTAKFYIGLARTCAAASEREAFWLERALVEGNEANLLAFFQGQIEEDEIPSGRGERCAEMQAKVEKALAAAEAFLTMHISPKPAEICQPVLDLSEAWDEETFGNIFGSLFPKSPTVTIALKARAVCQLRQLADYVLQETQEPELCQRARNIIAFADRLAATEYSTVSTAPVDTPTFPEGWVR